LENCLWILDKMAKTTMKFREMAKRLHAMAYNPKYDPLEGMVRVEGERFIQGVGAPCSRTYEFEHFKSAESCVYDDNIEFERDGLRDAVSALRSAVYPVVVDEISGGHGSFEQKVLLRKPVIGQDILKDEPKPEERETTGREEYNQGELGLDLQ